MYRKIYPINAFGVLAVCSVEKAIQALLTRYLGRGVSPDRGFGGFAFDMSSMLDDLKSAGGEIALRQLLDHPNFNPSLLTDDRFREALRESLGVDESTLQLWLITMPA